MGSPSGYLCLVLHAHLPYVRHPELEDSLEERWLFQALTESYIPIMDALLRLVGEGVPFKLTVSLSPPLLEMLDDDLLRARYKRHLQIMHDLAEKEVARLRGAPEMVALARMYRSGFERTYRLYTDDFGEDLAGVWKNLQSSGCLELMTSAATHGLLPLLLHEDSVSAQVRTGVSAFAQRFGSGPNGFWLPECAYSPELEPALAESGLSYFIMETHGILCATPRPRFGFHAPILTPGNLVAFGRDPECSNQVWSADEGYPGDEAYREFHRDIAYDLPADYLGEALPGGCPAPTGIKYHRVTDRRGEYKAIYDPERALSKAKIDAQNFVFWRNKEAEYWNAVNHRPPLMVAPFDAELLGHWWYEGPAWLEETLRLLAEPSQGVRTVTPTGYLELHPVAQIAQPAPSTWGYKGYSEVWVQGGNSWIYRHLHACQERMSQACRRHTGASGIIRRALNQAFRELLLAQSSDWPFIITSGTVPDYARKRLRLHIGRFQTLLSQADEGEIDPTFLDEIEERDRIFPGLDFEEFARVGTSSVVTGASAAVTEEPAGVTVASAAVTGEPAGVTVASAAVTGEPAGVTVASADTVP